ncbi:MAG: MFS transporter [Clostridiales bacterium]|nr:MFS transporter [Clostridiales bacterium]
MKNKQYTYRHTNFCCYRGYITQAIVNNLSPLLFTIFHDSYNISYEMLGQLVLINFITQILADIWATKYADKYGYRKCIVIAHGFCFTGLALLGILPILLPNSYIGLILAVMTYAIGGGIIEVIISPIVEALPNDNKEGSMSLLHSFYCWGQMAVVIISTLSLRILGRNLWPLLPLIWSLFPLYNMFIFRKVPIIPLVTDGNNMRLKELLSYRVIWLAMLLMICAGASELTMSQWSSTFAEKGLNVPKVYGDLLGPGLFALLMAIGRTLYGFFSDKLPLRISLIGSSILCVVAYLVTIFSSNPIVSLLFCSLCGLSVSLMWPGVFSLSSTTFPRGGTLMFGILAIFGDIGCSLGPWMAGKVSDLILQSGRGLSLWVSQGLNLEQIGLRTGLLTGTIFPTIMLLGLLLFKQSKKND